jgi:hypothetical protein
MSTLTSTQLQQQYIAYFGRPGDPAGINYWLSTTSGISSAREFADKIYAQDEYKKSTVGDKSIEEQVNSLYQNLFGRKGDAAGVLYWTGQIEAGTLQLSNVAYDLIWAASNPTSGNSAQAALDATALSNKVAAAESFTTNLESSTSAILAYQAESTSPWVSGSAFASAVTFIKTATATNAPVAADVTSAVTSMISAGTETSSAASTTLKLTTSTDALVGGAGDDTANGVLQDAGATGTTVAPGDSIDGKAGTDTFTISVAGAISGGAYTLSAVTLDNVEKLFFSNFDTHANAHTVEAGLMTGLTTVGLSASSATGDTTINGLKNNVDAEMRNGSADLTLTYNGSYAVTGTADTQNLTVSALTAGTFTSDGIETLNINSELAKSTITATASDALKTVNVTGSADLINSTALIWAGTTNSTTIDGYLDASAFTGKLTADVSGSTSTVSVKGGTGDDTIKFAGTLTKNDIVDGGAGTDKLTMTQATLTDQLTGVSNIETFAFDYVSDTAVAMDVSKLPAGVTTVEVDLQDNVDTTDATIDSTITNLGSQTVVLKHTTADDADANNNDGNKVTITAASDTSADTINVTLDAIGSYTGANFGYNEVDVANYETVNIAANNDAAGTVTTAEVATLTASSATSVVLTGNANTTLGSVTGGAMTSFDASALTGTLTTTFASTDKITATGSATKATTFKFGTTLDNNDTVVGGSATTDVLEAELSGETTETGKLNISGVETIKLTTSGANTLDFTNVTGATSVEIDANKQTITGFPLSTKIVSTTNDSSVKITAADATGSSDTLSLETQVTGASQTNTVEAADIETLALTVTDITAGGDDTVTYALTKFEGTTVTGTQKSTSADTVNVALGTLHKNVTSIDLSGTKGTQSASLTNATSAGTIKLSGGGTATVTGTAYADTFTIGKTAAKVHAITGGDGTDTLTLTADTGWVDPSGLNVEAVTIDVVPGNVDLSLANNKAFHATSTGITITGGNTLSSFSNIAQANTYLAATVKTLDASTFGGDLTVGVADDSFDDTVTITGGASTKDTITANYETGSTTYKGKSVGVETLKLESDGDAVVFDLSNTTGVTLVEAILQDTDDLTIDKMTAGQSVKLTTAVTTTSAGYVEAKLADASGSADTMTFELKAPSGTNDIDDGALLKTTDIETVTVKISSFAESISLANLSMATADATMSLVVTGDKALTVSALNADVTTIDASGMGEGGSIVQTGRSSVAAATYTGSDGDDTFQMKHSDDAIAAGAGTGDNLVITKNLLLGGIAVDLTKTADVLTTFNGASSASVQSGFEDVDLSNITGSFGAEVTAIKDGSTIVGTPNIDIITGGAGVDTITGGSGADIIYGKAGADIITTTNSGATDSASDLVYLENFDSMDTITATIGNTAPDKFVFDFSQLAGTGQYINLDDSAHAAVADTPILGVITGDQDLASITANANILVLNGVDVANASALETALETGGASDLKAGGDMAVNDTFLVAYDDGTNAYLAQVTVGGDGVADDTKPAAGELTAVNLVKLGGVTDVNNLHANNFDFF